MRTALLAAAILTPLGACASLPGMSPQTPMVGAVAGAVLSNAAGRDVALASFTQGPTGVLIRLEADGLTPGWHGVHIHETGQCAAPFTSAGAHVNHGSPKAPHGLLNPAGPDDGDLPNVHADARGHVSAELFSNRIRISPSGAGQWLLDADGSAIVIHANVDDHTTQPIGGSGDRVLCGVIDAST